MSVVDSSGWIEYLVRGPNSAVFRPEILDLTQLVVPTLVVTEVSRWLLVNNRPELVEEIQAAMSMGLVVPLDAAIAKRAAELGFRHKLALADSITYATGQLAGVDVWTQDRDFEGLPGVRYIPKSQ